MPPWRCRCRAGWTLSEYATEGPGRGMTSGPESLTVLVRGSDQVVRAQVVEAGEHGLFVIVLEHH